jgi:hypothetical protein
MPTPDELAERVAVIREAKLAAKREQGHQNRDTIGGIRVISNSIRRNGKTV